MNGVDLDSFDPTLTGESVDEDWNLSNRFACFYIGTIGMAHGLEVVNEAAKLLQERGRDDICFCIVGDGAQRAALQQEAENLGLEEGVKFFGRVSKQDVPDLLARADACLIHLRKTDLFATVIPSKIFETMAMQCPIIMGVEGQSREIVLKAEAAVTMEPGSAESLVDAVVGLADDSQLRDSLGRNGRQFVAEHFDRNQLAARYLELLCQIAGKSDE